MECKSENAHIAAYCKENSLLKMHFHSLPECQFKAFKTIRSRRGIFDAQKIHGFKFLIECTEDTFSVFDHILWRRHTSAFRSDKFAVISHILFLLVQYEYSAFLLFYTIKRKN